MTGVHVLRFFGIVLLLLGSGAILFQLFGPGSPVLWLGAIGPIVMGSALLIIAGMLQREC